MEFFDLFAPRESTLGTPKLPKPHRQAVTVRILEAEFGPWSLFTPTNQVALSASVVENFIPDNPAAKQSYHSVRGETGQQRHVCIYVCVCGRACV